MVLLSAAVCLCGVSAAYGAEIEVTDLRCEYLDNPLGIDVVRPRLSWKISAKGKPARGLRQKAYRILVASSPDLLAQNTGDLWDSKVESDQSIHIVYKGKPMTSRMRCFWKVRSWCSETIVSDWSKPARWTMGLLKPADWRGAKWIGIEKNAAAAEKAKDNRTRLPARYLRREFKVAGEVRRATAYVCGLGFFDLHINGKPVGDHIRDPGLTGYKKRAFYVTFDVSDYLAKGANAIGAVLGNGRYFAPREISPGKVKSMGYPKLLMHMRIEYKDGSVEDIVSDSNWKVTASGPIRSNNEFDGEEYDARMETPGWDRSGFDDSKWKSVELVSPPGGVMQAQMIEPMRIVETRKPVKITSPKDGMYIVDMGQSYYGSVRLKVSGPEGRRVQIRTAYNLNPDGTLRNRDNRSALSSDAYILKGKGQEVWNPRFRGQGYRYAEVTGFPGVPKAENFEGLVIHTDFASAGGFACSNPLINQIYSNIRWTQRAYIRSVPMEPDRDERQGWLGTQAKDFESNAYNFNMAALLSKWLGDIRLDQLDDGQLPDLSPTYWSFYHKSIVWPSSIAILPEVQHDFYGDRRALSDNYDAMTKWMKFTSRHLKPDSTTDFNFWGDWCDTYSMDKKGKEKGRTSRPLISTAYFYNNARIAARIARLLGKADDEKHFAALATKIKKGFNKRFFDAKTNQYGNGTQTSYILPLAFGMVDPDKRKAVGAKLVHDIMVTHKKHLSVGMVGMLYMMQVLTDIGHPEVGYAIATRTKRPSWGYMIGKGATTVWERWDTDTKGPGMNSEGLLILAGNLEAWFYQTLLGINNDPKQPGFKHIILRPCPVGDLTYAKGWHESMYGKIVSAWKRDGETFTWSVTVPPNTTATLHVPAGAASDVEEGGRPAGKSDGVKFLRMANGRAVFSAGSGSYEFASKLPANK